MSKQNSQNATAKKHFYELTLNDGRSKKFYYDRWCERESAIADYMAEQMKRLGHPQPFIASELRKAPWMITQSDLLTKTGYCSLDQAAKKAYLQYRYQRASQATA